MAATVTQLAFLVQLRPESKVEQQSFIGRVEHIASGDVAHFQGPEELLAFIVRVLNEGRAGTAGEAPILPLS